MLSPRRYSRQKLHNLSVSKANGLILVDEIEIQMVKLCLLMISKLVSNFLGGVR